MSRFCRVVSGFVRSESDLSFFLHERNYRILQLEEQYESSIQNREFRSDPDPAFVKLDPDPDSICSDLSYEIRRISQIFPFFNKIKLKECNFINLDTDPVFVRSLSFQSSSGLETLLVKGLLPCKLHQTGLLVEGKVFHVDGAAGLEDGGAQPRHLPRACHQHVCAQRSYIVKGQVSLLHS